LERQASQVSCLDNKITSTSQKSTPQSKTNEISKLKQNVQSKIKTSGAKTKCPEQKQNVPCKHKMSLPLLFAISEKDSLGCPSCQHTHFE